MGTDRHKRGFEDAFVSIPFIIYLYSSSSLSLFTTDAKLLTLGLFSNGDPSEILQPRLDQTLSRIRRSLNCRLHRGAPSLLALLGGSRRPQPLLLRRCLPFHLSSLLLRLLLPTPPFHPRRYLSLSDLSLDKIPSIAPVWDPGS